jgi:hypothetical protein
MIELNQCPKFPIKPIFEGSPTFQDYGYQFFRATAIPNRVERDLLVQLVENEVCCYYVIARHKFPDAHSMLCIAYQRIPSDYEIGYRGFEQWIRRRLRNHGGIQTYD